MVEPLDIWLFVLTVYAENDPVWLKQHAWSLNLLVAGIAFYAYKKSGFST